MYDICSKQLITKFSYTSLDCIDSFWRLYEESNKFILFDTLSGRIINNNGRYDEYNLKCNDTEYYWGDIKRATYRVPIYGTLNKLFVTARYIIPQERICNFDDFWFWEPTLWRVTINKRDQTVSAYKETPFIDEQDIKVDDLKELVEAYIHK